MLDPPGLVHIRSEHFLILPTLELINGFFSQFTDIINQLISPLINLVKNLVNNLVLPFEHFDK